MTRPAPQAAVAWVYAAAGEALAGRQPVAIDATGAAPLDRATWLQLAREHQASSVAVVFRVPLGTALARNRRRRRQVPDEVISRMWQAINDTSPRDLLAEGFAAVLELSPVPTRRIRSTRLETAHAVCPQERGHGVGNGAPVRRRAIPVQDTGPRRNGAAATARPTWAGGW